MKIFARWIACLCLLVFSGCHSEVSGPQSAVVAAPLPSSGIDWTKVTAQAPQKSSDLGLWLRADIGVTLSKDGARVTSWKDESPNHLEFLSPEKDHEGPVLVKPSAEHPGSAIRFSGKDQQLVSANILGSKLMGADEVSVFVVMQETSAGGVSDTVGWGGCGENRLNSHFTAGNALVFQMGNPSVSAIGTGAPGGWVGHTHVVSVVVKGKDARMSLDGVELLSSSKFKSSVNRDTQSPITIAGVCSNGFKGEISEIMIFKKGMPRTKELQLLKSLAQKYSLQMR
jgi:hypothetical protein